MSERGLLTICVVCASGISNIDAWGKGVCVAMEEEAADFPDGFAPFTKSAFAKSGEDEGVVVLHALVPADKQDEYIEAMMTSCGLSGSIGACVASIDASSTAGYVADISRLRAFKVKGTIPAEELAGIEWVRALAIAGDEEASMKEATRAVMLFIDFLDVQFDFARDIEGFLQAQRGAAGMPDYSTN